jgi:single-strand DNA-binding protein
MNKIILSGRLTQKPLEIKQTTTGTLVLANSLAVNEGKDKTIFVNVIFFNATAEYVVNYLKDGGRLIVEGKLDISDYQGADGVTKKSTKVLVDRAEILDFVPSAQTPQQQ